MRRVLVVDDSHFTQSQVASYFEEAGFEVVGKARNGKQAISMVRELEPDVVTMDVKMPGMDGIEAVRRIMQEHPTPVVMLSRYTEEGAETTMEALEAGAVDFFHKPGEEPSIDLYEYKTELVETVRQAAKVEPEPLAPSEPAADTGGSAAVEPEVDLRPDANPVIVIASSTGGPRLLKEHLRGLPYDAGLRVVLVQHLNESFTGTFADDLDGITDYTVRESTARDTVEPGEILVANGGSHLEVVADDGTTLTVRHVDGYEDLTVEPAADVTMRSAADKVQGPLVGVVLTGLGSDGTDGVAAIKEAGGRTLAQDEETSPAHWMPTSARESGHVDRVFAAEELVAAVVEAAHATTEDA